MLRESAPVPPSMVLLPAPFTMMVSSPKPPETISLPEPV